MAAVRLQDLLECQRRNDAFEKENKELMAKLQVLTGYSHSRGTRIGFSMGTLGILMAFEEENQMLMAKLQARLPWRGTHAVLTLYSRGTPVMLWILWFEKGRKDGS